MQRPPKVTMKEISAKSGVSPATVCRVLSNSGYPVSEETRKKVLAAAEALGYSGAAGAQQFREIAVMIPTVGNHFYTALISGLEGALTAEGYRLLFYHTDLEPGPEAGNHLLQSALSKGVAGIIAASSGMYGVLHQKFRLLRDRGVEVVLADSPIPTPYYSSVFFDYRKGACLGAEYLIGQGHRRIVYAGLPLDRESRQQRVEGFRQAVQGHHLEAECCPVVTASDKRPLEAGEALARQILALPQMPTAVLAMNDMLAFGMGRYFQQQGLSIPGDLSILGFDDSPFCQVVCPRLSSVRVQPEQMGRMAAMLLMDKIRGSNESPVQLSIEPAIVERESVGKPNEK